MRRCASILAGVMLAGAACAAPAPYPLKVNWDDPYGPTLPLYRSAARTVRATFASGTNATDLTGWTPYMSVSTSSTASAVTTAAVSVVSAAAGLVDFTFSGINLAPGWYFYETGASSGGTTVVARTGRVAMRGSPFSAGATSWSTNFPIASYTWVGTFPTSSIPWSFLSGVYLTAESDPYWLAASNGVTVNAANGATAYGWGNHATNGYLTSYAETDPTLPAHTNLTLAGGAHGGEFDPVWSAWTNSLGALAYSNSVTFTEADTNALAALATHTNLPLASSGHGPELDPSWAAASGSVLYAESDTLATVLARGSDGGGAPVSNVTKITANQYGDFQAILGDELNARAGYFSDSATITTIGTYLLGIHSEDISGTYAADLIDFPHRRSARFTDGVTSNHFDTGTYAQDIYGNVRVSGSIAGTHTGDGSGLTGLDYASITNPPSIPSTNGFIQGVDVPGYETDTNAIAALATHTNLPIATSGHGPELDPVYSAASKVTSMNTLTGAVTIAAAGGLTATTNSATGTLTLTAAERDTDHFYVTASSDQSVGPSSLTKVMFDAAVTNENTVFNLAGDTFTFSGVGWCTVSAMVGFRDLADGQTTLLGLGLNGSASPGSLRMALSVQGAAASPHIGGTIQFYNSSATNIYQLTEFHNNASTRTNNSAFVVLSGKREVWP